MAHDLSLIADPILITGVNGFIAGHLAERLVAAGKQVVGLARRPERASWLAAQGVDVRQGDLWDQGSIEVAMQGCRTVVHAAAYTGGPGVSREVAWRTNVSGTAQVCQAAERAGAGRLLMISSVAVYGVNSAAVISEEAPTPPVGELYSDSKIAAESVVRCGSVPWVIIRPASTFVPRGAAWTIRPIEQIQDHQLVLFRGERGLVSPGYIENFIDGLVLALARPEAIGETFNLCDGEAVTFREFYLYYARMVGQSTLPSLPAFLPPLARSAPARVLRRILGKATVGPWSYHFRFNPSRYSIEKATRLIGYRPTIALPDAMARTETWLRSAGYLPARE